jgi:hypothetical protein
LLKIVIHPLFLAAAVALTSQTFAANPSERVKASIEASRYDRSSARELKSEEKSLFGPKSGRYRYDARMLRAAEIAAARARKHSTKRCWRYVKGALVDAKAIDSRPDTAYAKQAAAELTKEYGFRKLPVDCPYEAPVGSVLVYGGRGAGHVEFRTKKGFVSDFFSLTPSKRPFIGAFVKPAS